MPRITIDISPHSRFFSVMLRLEVSMLFEPVDFWTQGEGHGFDGGSTGLTNDVLRYCNRSFPTALLGSQKLKSSLSITPLLLNGDIVPIRHSTTYTVVLST